MAVDVKERAHNLIETLPADRLEEALRLLEGLAEPRYTLATAHLAPLDDEEETEEERRDVAEAREAMARGEGISLEDWLRRRVNLPSQSAGSAAVSV